MPSKKRKVPIPKWILDPPKKQKKKKPHKTSIQTPKTSPTIKTESIDGKCPCAGEIENCFICNGTGFYKKTIITNIEECKDRIQERKPIHVNSIQESNFSNDQRGGIYGIREQGRFSSNPLYEEDS